jgi:hypothetical protein
MTPVERQQRRQAHDAFWQDIHFVQGLMAEGMPQAAILRRLEAQAGLKWDAEWQAYIDLDGEGR